MQNDFDAKKIRNAKEILENKLHNAREMLNMQKDREKFHKYKNSFLNIFVESIKKLF